MKEVLGMAAAVCFGVGAVTNEPAVIATGSGDGKAQGVVVRAAKPGLSILKRRQGADDPVVAAIGGGVSKGGEAVVLKGLPEGRHGLSFGWAPDSDESKGKGKAKAKAKSKSKSKSKGKAKGEGLAGLRFVGPKSGSGHSFAYKLEDGKLELLGEGEHDVRVLKGLGDGKLELLGDGEHDVRVFKTKGDGKLELLGDGEHRFRVFRSDDGGEHRAIVVKGGKGTWAGHLDEEAIFELADGDDDDSPKVLRFRSGPGGKHTVFRHRGDGHEQDDVDVLIERLREREHEHEHEHEHADEDDDHDHARIHAPHVFRVPGRRAAKAAAPRYLRLPSALKMHGVTIDGLDGLDEHLADLGVELRGLGDLSELEDVIVDFTEDLEDVEDVEEIEELRADLTEDISDVILDLIEDRADAEEDARDAREDMEDELIDLMEDLRDEIRSLRREVDELKKQIRANVVYANL